MNDEEVTKELAEDRELADAVACALAYSDSRETFEKLIKNDIEAPEVEGCEALSRLSNRAVEELNGAPYRAKAFSGYGRIGLQALDKLVEEFEKGAFSLAEAQERAGLPKPRVTETNRSTHLLPYDKFDPGCTNPVVLRAMRSFRACCNKMIDTYGYPDEIHIELGTELKMSRYQYRKFTKRRADNERRNNEAKKLCAEILGYDRVEDVPEKKWRKRLLWEECGGRDLYTNREIDEIKAIKDETYAHVDHILPIARTGDNSWQNKLLVLADSNAGSYRSKNNRTPHEWIMKEQGEEGWGEFVARAQCLLKNGKISKRKYDNLTCVDLASKEEKFIARNLNDTRWMTRRASQWVKSCLGFPDEKGNLVPPKVVTPAGRLTHALRKNWGFAGKDRADLRHHAVDAAIIAATTPDAIIRANEVSSRDELSMDELEVGLPWASFREQVLETCERAVPSHFASRNPSGALFKETIYSVKEISSDGNTASYYTGAGVNRKVKKTSNYVLTKDGKGLYIGCGQAFLQLWWDPGDGSESGRWYADPVYRYELPAIKNGTYSPKLLSGKSSLLGVKREETLKRMEGPLRIFEGDTIEIKGQIRIYASFNICKSGRRFELYGVMQEKSTKNKTVAKKGLNFPELGHDEIKVLNVTPLGWPGYLA